MHFCDCAGEIGDCRGAKRHRSGRFGNRRVLICVCAARCCVSESSSAVRYADLRARSFYTLRIAHDWRRVFSRTSVHFSVIGHPRGLIQNAQALVP
jgi:hypothetical protein